MLSRSLLAHEIFVVIFSGCVTFSRELKISNSQPKNNSHAQFLSRVGRIIFALKSVWFRHRHSQFTCNTNPRPICFCFKARAGNRVGLYCEHLRHAWNSDSLSCVCMSVCVYHVHFVPAMRFLLVRPIKKEKVKKTMKSTSSKLICQWTSRVHIQYHQYWHKNALFRRWKWAYIGLRFKNWCPRCILQ